MNGPAAAAAPLGAARTAGSSSRDRHRPARRAGALTVLVDGAAVLFAERGGRSLLTFSADPVVLTAAAEALAERVAVRPDRLADHQPDRRRRGAFSARRPVSRR